MVIDRPTVERTTLKISNISLTATTQDLFDFLESTIGKATIFVSKSSLTKKLEIMVVVVERGSELLKLEEEDLGKYIKRLYLGR